MRPPVHKPLVSGVGGLYPVLVGPGSDLGPSPSPGGLGQALGEQAPLDPVLGGPGSDLGPSPSPSPGGLGQALGQQAPLDPVLGGPGSDLGPSPSPSPGGLGQALGLQAPLDPVLGGPSPSPSPSPGGLGQALGQQAPPQASLWMTSRPNPLPNCPPGLEYLTLLDCLYVNQEVDMVEVRTYLDTPNRYKVFNANGEQIFFASEDSRAFSSGNCCAGGNRKFLLHVLDSTGLEVIRIDRPVARVICHCICCLPHAKVEAPAGNIIAVITQIDGGGFIKITVEDGNGKVIFKIVGPSYHAFHMNVYMPTGKNLEFNVYTPDESRSVGNITKHFGGFEKEYFTKADNYSIRFPNDLSVDMKAVLLGVCFLIDFIYFEFVTPHHIAQTRRHQ